MLPKEEKSCPYEAKPHNHDWHLLITVDSEPPNGSKEDITNQCESEQALDVSAGTLLSTAVQASVINVKWRLLKITLQAPFLNVQMMTKGSYYDNSGPVPPRQNVVPTAEKTDSSDHGLEFLFSPLIEEYYTLTHGQAEENNNDQAPNASFQEAEFINPFLSHPADWGLDITVSWA
ncbi:hypothetical protein Tco_0435845 [Tanacetum coccineum]